VAFKTFVDAVALPASDLNTYLMKQAVIVCTSGTRPASPPEGMTIFETDTDLVRIYNGAAWVALNGHTQQRNTGAQSIPNGAFTVLTWNTADFDNVSAVSANVYSAPWTGKYEVAGSVGYVANASGRRLARVYVAGSPPASAPEITEQAWSAISGPTVTIPPCTVSATSGQSIGIATYQDAGVALDTTPASCFLRVRPLL